jgi:hypothetical protein
MIRSKSPQAGEQLASIQKDALTQGDRSRVCFDTIGVEPSTRRRTKEPENMRCFRWPTSCSASGMNGALWRRGCFTVLDVNKESGHELSKTHGCVIGDGTCLAISALAQDARACGREWYPEVMVDPRIHGVAQAEKNLHSGNRLTPDSRGPKPSAI